MPLPTFIFYLQSSAPREKCCMALKSLNSVWVPILVQTLNSFLSFGSIYNLPLPLFSRLLNCDNNSNHLTEMILSLPSECLFARITEIKQENKGTSGWLSGWASAFGPGHDPRVLGLNPASGSPQGTRFSFCLCFCLSLCVSHEWMNEWINK